ncbi:hypothetical protein [Legionella jamestowniensis]|nr:hypothetical protein [Legionella jamestowniensis]
MSKNDWFSLRLVNSAWKSIVSAAATAHLDSIQQDQLSQLMSTDYEFLLQKLIEEVKRLRKQSNRGTVRDTEEKLQLIGTSIQNLQEPLAKFLLLKEQLENIDLALSKKYSSIHSFFAKEMGRNSNYKPLKDIIKPVLETCTNFSESPWFQKMLICIKLCPEHQVSQSFNQAILKVAERKESMANVEVKKHNSNIINMFPSFSSEEKSISIPVDLNLSLFSIPKITITPELKPNRSIKRNP